MEWAWECNNHQEALTGVFNNKTRSAIHLVEWDNNLEFHNKIRHSRLAQSLVADKLEIWLNNLGRYHKEELQTLVF